MTPERLALKQTGASINERGKPQSNLPEIASSNNTKGTKNKFCFKLSPFFKKH